MSIKIDPPELPSEGFNVPEIRLPSENKIWANIRGLSVSNNRIRAVLAVLFVVILGIVFFLSSEKYAATPSDATAPSKESVSPLVKPVADEPKKKSSKPSSNPKKPKSEKSTQKSGESVQKNTVQNNASSEASTAPSPGGDAVKQGSKKECTQGEVALHQC